MSTDLAKFFATGGIVCSALSFLEIRFLVGAAVCFLAAVLLDEIEKSGRGGPPWRNRNA